MAEEQQGTKESLLNAAGELFAESGYGGTSTRSIAGKAEANMAAINYHFGSKENLYLESLKHVLDEKCSWGDSLEQALEMTKEGTSITDALEHAIRQRFAEHFGKNKPLWQTKLMIRTLLEPSPTLKALSEENFAPEFDRVKAVARTWNPDLSEEEAFLWANSLFGQEVIYALARSVILVFENWEKYPEEFMNRVARQIAGLMSAALWPEKLEQVTE